MCIIHRRNNGIWVKIEKFGQPQISMRADEQKLTIILEWPYIAHTNIAEIVIHINNIVYTLKSSMVTLPKKSIENWATVGNPSLYATSPGVRRKRLKGDVWVYKRICEQIFKATKL